MLRCFTIAAAFAVPFTLVFLIFIDFVFFFEFRLFFDFTFFFDFGLFLDLFNFNTEVFGFGFKLVEPFFFKPGFFVGRLGAFCISGFIFELLGQLHRIRLGLKGFFALAWRSFNFLLFLFGGSFGFFGLLRSAHLLCGLHRHHRAHIIHSG